MREDRRNQNKKKKELLSSFIYTIKLDIHVKLYKMSENEKSLNSKLKNNFKLKRNAIFRASKNTPKLAIFPGYDWQVVRIQ